MILIYIYIYIYITKLQEQYEECENLLLKSIRRTGTSGLKMQNSKAMESSAAVNGVQGSLLGMGQEKI